MAKDSNDSHFQSYEQRLQRVTEFIHQNLEGEVDLNRLAEVACLSPYHWHRIYHAVHGETAAATVRRLRLHRAASQLANSDLAVGTIAKRNGFGSAEVFTRLFRTSYGLPPAQYRRRGNHVQFQMAIHHGEPDMYPVEIRHIPPAQAITVAHKGAYLQIGKAFELLFGTLGARGLLRPNTRMVALYYNDPAAVAEAELRSRAGAIIDDPQGAAGGALELAEVRGGEYAVLHYKGPYSAMHAAYQWLYGTWLLESGREVADAPAFEEYLNSPRDTPPAELLTEICLPLR